jgi:hypothetical protein
MLKLSLTVILAALSFTQITKSQTLRPKQSTLYVTPGGISDGSCFGKPSNLADALKWAHDKRDSLKQAGPFKIFIRWGTYQPRYRGDNMNSTTGRDATFRMVANVQLYGGFVSNMYSCSTEQVDANCICFGDKALEIKSFRDLERNQTILSGDMHSNDTFSGSGNGMNYGNYGDNVNHVMIAVNDLKAASVDGVVFKGGYAKDGSDVTVDGQGLNREYGASIYVDNGNLEIRNTIFRHNYAEKRGAGIYAEQGSSITLYNCLFYRNKCTNDSGDGASIHVRNSNNKASYAKIVNCTFANNHANDGGALYVHDKSIADVINSIAYGNTSKNSGKENFGTESNGVINLHHTTITDPSFVSSSDDNYRLKAGSSALNASNNSDIPNEDNYLFDIAGAQRKFGTADRGAYEHEIAIGINDRKIFVKPYGKGDGKSWNTATNLVDALNWANNNGGNTTETWAWNEQLPLQIWATKGSYITNRTSFVIPNNVKLVGHFSGNETAISQRALPTDYKFQSNLNGNNNTWHLVKINNANGLVEIDGFKISNGRAANTGVSQFDSSLTGGGAYIMSSNVVFKNVNFSDNYAFTSGAGVYSSNSNARYQNAAFINNRTETTYEGHQGGGIFQYGGNLEVDNSYFTRNYTSVGQGIYFNGYNNSMHVRNSNFSHNHGYLSGGAIAIASNLNSSIFIVNTLINDNKAFSGTALHSYSNTPVNLINTTIINNNGSSTGGGAAFAGTGRFNLTNTIVFNNRLFNGSLTNSGNQTTKNSLIEGSYDENGTWLLGTGGANGNNVNSYNLTMNDIFNDPANNDFTLKNTSPAVNKGDKNIFNAGNTPDLSALTKDLAGNTRIFGDQVDIGAYENQTVIAPLPIELKDFTIAKINNSAKLSWSTLSEQNNKEFIVYRSTDGVSFSEISRINGVGNSSSLVAYNFVDTKPLNGTNYYQLKQVDFDGKTTDLGIRFVNFSIANAKVSIYPNPTARVVNVLFEANNFNSARLIDSSGKIIEKTDITPNATNIGFDLAKYSNGVYFVQLAGRETAIVKIIKK